MSEAKSLVATRRMNQDDETTVIKSCVQVSIWADDYQACLLNFLVIEFFDISNVISNIAMHVLIIFFLFVKSTTALPLGPIQTKSPST